MFGAFYPGAAFPADGPVASYNPWSPGLMSAELEAAHAPGLDVTAPLSFDYYNNVFNDRQKPVAPKQLLKR